MDQFDSFFGGHLMIRILTFGLSTGMGGVETYLMNLYRNIDRTKIQFDFVVAGNTCHYANEIETLGGKVFYITPKKDSLSRNVRDLLRILKRYKQTHEVLYFNLSVLFYCLPFLFVKLYRYPIIISHGHNTRDNKTTVKLRYILHCLNRPYVARSSSYLLACSDPAARWVFGNAAVRNGKVKIVPNAISTQKYSYNETIRHKVRKELSIRDDQFIIGNVGRITYPKNQEYLVDIFYEIRKLNSNALLLVVGDGDKRPELEKKITDLGLSDCIVLTGARSDVPELMQAMDIFVLPSRFEGLGIVLIEAQASGLRCIASKEVPKQVNLTGLVDFVDLNKGPKFWANEVVKVLEDHQVCGRYDRASEIRKWGYDIVDMAKDFEDFVVRINHDRV